MTETVLKVCRGCGAKTRLYYGLCVDCQMLPPYKRPLHPRYKPTKKRANQSTIKRPAKQSGILAIRLGKREFLVCGCDYMTVPINAKMHSVFKCPNPKTIFVVKGHENGL